MMTIIEVRVALATRPLALQPGALHRLNALLDSGGLRPSAATHHGADLQSNSGRISQLKSQRRGAPSVPPRSGRTAVIAVHGVLTQRPSLLEMFGLGTSCASISSQLRTALADSSVDRIVLDVDSEGGETSGVTELASQIRDALGTKPIIGIANSLCASAAFWVASACSQIFVTPGGQIGGVGVITQHTDQSKALEMAGIKMTIISAGRYKAETASSAPLSQDARRYMHAMVSAIGATFTRDVATGRRVAPATVNRDFGQGRMLRAQDAVRAGMADGVATLDEVLQMTGRTGTSSSLRAKQQSLLWSAGSARLDMIAGSTPSDAARRANARRRRELELLA